LALAAEQLGLEHASLCIYDSTQGSLLIEAAHGLSPSEILGLQAGAGGASRTVVRTGRPVMVPDITHDPRFSAHHTVIPGGVRRTAVSVPIYAADDLVGTLTAFRPVSRTFTLRDDMRSLTVLAGLMAPAIRAQLGGPGGGLSPGTPAISYGHGLVGRSKRMKEVFALTGQVANSSAPVLLTGERGSGKQALAALIHRLSPRKSSRLVKVHCAALPISRVDRELFGHESGAFPGASVQRRGRWESAHRGTIFLDQVGDLPNMAQVRLARAMSDGVFEREGGTQPIEADVRVIASGTSPVNEMVVGGELEEALAARLRVFPIQVPPLRERRSDIILLADHFVDVYNVEHRKQVRRLSTSAIDLLMAYHWPGNVRELESCMERAVLLARGDVILGNHLPPSLQTAESTGTGLRGGLASQLGRVEKEILLDALKSSRGNMAEAARRLQITERVMGLRVAKYRIKPKRFKTWS